MGQVIKLKEVHQARQRRAEKMSVEQCVELLEWNLRRSLDQYFSSPPEERAIRATQMRKLSELLEYALRLF